MDFREIAPFIVPAIMLQLFVQVHYVLKVANNKKIPKQTRLKYAIGILLFNLPIAAVYLLKHEKTAFNKSQKYEVYPSYIRQAVFVLLVSAFEIVILKLIIDYINVSQLYILVWLSGLLLVLLIASELAVQVNKEKISYVFYGVVIVITFAIEYFMNNTNSLLLIIIMSGFIINHFSIKVAKVLSLFMVSAYVLVGVILYIQNPLPVEVDSVISNVYLNLIVYGLIILAFYMLKKVYLVNMQINSTLTLLEKQNELIESLSAASERNKIAKEIHDTVGHHLTGAIILLENALITPSLHEKDQHINTSKQLVKNALADVRQSVKMLVEETTKSFYEKVDDLLNNIKQSMALDIEFVCEVSSTLLSVHQHILLRAIMECSTNTVKHSDATSASLLLSQSNRLLYFSYSDNGSKVAQFDLGFGLQTMKDSIEGVGGTFQASSNDDGFMVNITIPLGSKLKDENNEEN